METMKHQGKRVQHQRFSGRALLQVVISLVAILAGGSFFFFSPLRVIQAAKSGTQDPQPNMNCTLIVPPHPLTAQGLATPYQLVATNPNDGPCHETDPAQAAFVQGSIFDFDTGQIFVYNPLVIDQASEPAIAPVTPSFSSDAVVALWFGFNGATLTLQASGNSLQDGRCVNGVKDSLFTQFAYCNAPLFFGEVNQAIDLGLLTPPALGQGRDGQICPSVRDFGVVDQDQSDNVVTRYLVANGHLAQFTSANQKALPGAQPLTNGSDNGLLDTFIDPALGCVPWMAPDLADPGHLVPALPLNELQARVDQKEPVAFVPLNDPMVLDANNNFDLDKANAYRAGVDQPRALTVSQADPVAYCHNLKTVGAARIVLDAPLTVNVSTPDSATGNTLFTFLAQRFVNSYMNLGCQKLLGKPSPITTVQDGNGVATSAAFKGNPINTGQAGGPDCNVNGQVIAGCTGTVTINGQPCTLSSANNTVTMTCVGNTP